MSSLKRIFFDRHQLKDQQRLSITGDMHHHLFHVCRLKPGDQLILVDEQYQETIGRVLTSDARQAWVQVHTELALPSPRSKPSCDVYLYLAVLKAPAMEWAIQKSVELGVHTIAPLLFKRTIVHWKGQRAAEKSASKGQRWQAIADSAARQAGLVRCPQVLPPMDFRDAAASWSAASQPHPVPRFFCNEHEREATLKRYNADLKHARCVWVLTGPEGGLTQMETDLLRKSHWKSVLLGVCTLRAETAPLVALAQLQFMGLT